MNSQSVPTLRRTLIVTRGELAAAAAAQLQARLVESETPQAALAVVGADDGVDGLADTLTAALQRVSRTAVPVELAAAGWRLGERDALTLVLICDVAPAHAGWPAAVCRQVAALAARQLGISIQTLLVWLAGEAAPAGLRDCLLAGEAEAAAFGLGILLQGPVTLDGLAMDDIDHLTETVALGLWLLLTTPLQTAVADLTGLPLPGSAPLPFAVLGAAVWAWDPARLQPLLAARLRRQVLALWRRPAEAGPHPEAVSAWLADRDLSPDRLQQQAHAVDLPASGLDGDDWWRMPRPWRLGAGWTAMQAAADLDRDTLKPFEQPARTLLPAAEHARQALRTQLVGLSDANPVGGPARAAAWAAAVDDLCAAWLGRLHALQDEQDVVMVQLGEERGALYARRREVAGAWPDSDWARWRRLLLRPWRWPGLIWRYRELCRMGRQEQRLLARQAAVRRQLLQLGWIKQAVAALQTLARDEWRRVDEVASMLGCIQEKAQAVVSDIGESDSALLAALHQRLTLDTAQLATAAAAALGGLGAYIGDPDDARLWAQLSDYLLAQTTAAQQVNALALLVTLHAEDGASLDDWWPSLAAEAAPLWRYDMTFLPESARSAHNRRLYLGGKGVDAAAAQLPAELAATPVTLIETTDSRRLFLLSWHSHLSAAALLREELDDVQL